jgi:predicted AlkP superfamily phosphohydrolase/phosphomutase
MIDFRNAWSLSVLVLASAFVTAASSGGGTPAAEGETPPVPAAPATSEAPAPAGRLVILGFDGADANKLRELMDARPQDFANIAKLAAEGTFAPLEVVAPPESPVSWASLNTGQNPAKTGVPGFVKRTFKYGPPSPDLGHIEQTTVKLEEFEDLPLAAPLVAKPAAIAGMAAFVAVGLLIFLVFRRPILATLVGFVCGVLGAGAGAAFGMIRVGSYLPDEIPCTRNPNAARNLWDYAADAGVPSVILDAAEAFCMDAPDGAKVLAGLGVPDARNGIGEWFVYTSDPSVGKAEGKSTSTAGTIFLVERKESRIESKVYGPKDFWREGNLKKEKAEVEEALKGAGLSRDDSLRLSTRKQELDNALDTGKLDVRNKHVGLRTSLDLAVEIEGERARVKIGDQEQTLGVGDWSEFYELTFRMNPLLEVHALTRARLIALEPHFELLVNVLDIDPRKPPFWQPISDPPGFSAELAQANGLFETYGWPTLTMPVKDSVIDAELLLEDVEFTEAWRETLTQSALARDDWRLLMSVFSTADRVQHMMYQFYDPTHPLHDAARASEEVEFFGERITLADAIPAIYRKMDRIIGEVRSKMRPEDTLIVCSDHGFQTFHRQVSLNNWLAEQGYLAVKPNPPTTQALLFVDWTRTKAYSLGMGFIYLNLQGREPGGIVSAQEAPALLAEIRSKLLESTDPDSGAKYCKHVYVTKEIHGGPHLDLEADLIVGFAPPYRVSWSTTGGGIGLREGQLGPICSNNDSPWSGDHISIALEDVPGVFLSNRRFRVPEGGAKALHIAPTALALLGVAKPAAMDLEPLELAP